MFRFTIRDLIWLMVVAAFAVFWYLEREGRIEETDRIRNAFRENESLKAELRQTQIELRRVRTPAIRFHLERPPREASSE